MDPWPLFRYTQYNLHDTSSHSSYIIIGFLINMQVQGQHPHQWAPFQIAGLLHAWQISYLISTLSLSIFIQTISCIAFIVPEKYVTKIFKNDKIWKLMKGHNLWALGTILTLHLPYLRNQVWYKFHRSRTTNIKVIEQNAF